MIFSQALKFCECVTEIPLPSRVAQHPLTTAEWGNENFIAGVTNPYFTLSIWSLSDLLILQFFPLKVRFMHWAAWRKRRRLGNNFKCFSYPRCINFSLPHLWNKTHPKQQKPEVKLKYVMRTFQIRQRKDQAFSSGHTLNYYQQRPIYYHHHYSLSFFV